jgi:hypothetical protein
VLPPRAPCDARGPDDRVTCRMTMQ